MEAVGWAKRAVSLVKSETGSAFYPTGWEKSETRLHFFVRKSLGIRAGLSCEREARVWRRAGFACEGLVRIAFHRCDFVGERRPVRACGRCVPRRSRKEC